MKPIAFAIAAGLLATACATPLDTAPAPSLKEEVAVAAYDYDQAFLPDDRPAEDYEMYKIRKSRQVLEFTGVQPGMTVVDLEAGGGTYTELLSIVAGEEGKVYLQNPPEFDSFLGDAVEKRMDGRLANVTHLKTPFDDLEAVGDGEADLVTWMLGPHELWYTPKGSEPGVFGDPEKTFREIARVLGTGGHFVVLDHKAHPGAPATTGGETHRIDRAIIQELAEDAGLRLVAESDVLANPEDDHNLSVFDPAVRRKTDRFLLKFVKD